ncbi:MAG: hypothetical protein K0R11_2314, partial [Acidimicrobiales bacterium]|nr:hypothetical protein [Acidimicrobiales bacterium]
MRVGILTLHCGGNYGAVLQAYSLARAVREAGHDVEVVDYRTQTGVAHYQRYDVAVAGSDQIWDLTTERGLETCFFLDWADPRTTARISYGPSVGPTTELGPHAEALVPLLSSMDATSVRDDGSVALVSAATGRIPEKVLDPTFLVDFEDVLVRPRRRRPYLALYGYVRDPAVLAAIRRLADERGLDVVSLGFRNPVARRSRIGLGPDEWLGELAGADYVVTSFYHGLVFALRFGRPFTALPKEGKAHKVDDLLRIVGLEERTR